MESMFVKTNPIMAARAQLWEGTNSEKKKGNGNNKQTITSLYVCINNIKNINPTAYVTATLLCQVAVLFLHSESIMYELLAPRITLTHSAAVHSSLIVQ